MIIKCNICKAEIKDIWLPELVEDHKWTGTWRKRNNREIQFFYCPKHSITAISNFEGKL